MFRPPRCPHRGCRFHAAPTPDFFHRHGSYEPKCRPRPVPRFRCKACRRTFSRQTFRMDYRDKKPSRNVPLFLELASGIGLRQASRKLGLSRRCTELKARKLCRHLRRLHLNLSGPLPEGCELQLDELETYEGKRSTRPLTVPVVIERESRFVVWAESAPIRPSGRMTPKRRAAVAAEDAIRPRKDQSRRAVRRALARVVPLVEGHAQVCLATDEKSTYPGLAEEAFGKERLVHTRTSSKLARGTWNPLFAINHTEAMARDLLGRLRRDSWLASKKRRYLDLTLHAFVTYRNYVRRRFNHVRESAAELLGFLPRRLRPGEVLSWRQDWRERSIHPLARDSASVAEWRSARVVRAA